MTQQSQFGSHWNRKILLSLSILLGTAEGYSAFVAQPAYAAGTQQSAAVYKQFQTYVQQSSTLAKARSYLINHIDEAGLWYATQMTLQLENAQKAELPKYTEKLDPEAVRQAIDAAVRKNGLTYTSLLNNIKDSKIRAVLIEGRDKGYKIRTSEGMYYPVMNYESYKAFKPHIKTDIGTYIDMMAAESNKPSLKEGSIIISWNELLARTLAMEDFVNRYPLSDRLEAVKLALWSKKVNLFIGSGNTPAYDYMEEGAPVIINSELRQAYEAAILTGNGDSELLRALEELLALLDRNNNEFTPDVQKFINTYLDPN
ncbi:MULTISPECIES: hypothetical protein [Paenibacillus]|uniref:Uncharacterized protein n=1 Tax=Paenibacillus borealis TaxID=160799 RepID=A0ABX3HQC8_PAEBO|nr:hypothetical protein [Paenibacillus borealis]OMD52422.1 hypothetical protein BSK56_03155 [Paenibacillus borealis]